MLAGSSLIGRSIVEARLGERFELEVVGHTRDRRLRPVPGGFEKMEERDIFAHAATVGELFQTRLRGFADHPLVGDARGVGLIGALELVADKETKASFDASMGVGAYLMNRCEANGVILRSLGDTLAFCPPLIINQHQVDELFSSVETALDETLQWVR